VRTPIHDPLYWCTQSARWSDATSEGVSDGDCEGPPGGRSPPARRAGGGTGGGGGTGATQGAASRRTADAGPNCCVRTANGEMTTSSDIADRGGLMEDRRVQCVPFGSFLQKFRSDMGTQVKGYWDRSREKGRGGWEGRETETESEGEGEGRREGGREGGRERGREGVMYIYTHTHVHMYIYTHTLIYERDRQRAHRG
jgi:hypothetical protein